MEQATPILESFTESVGDGPSQPLLRKLMSLMFQPEIPGADISGFFPAGTSGQRRWLADTVEDITQPVEHPLGEVESVVQSGFRFPGCDSPRPENYFSDSTVPVDLVDKVPLELLHAVNNALASTSRSQDGATELSAPPGDRREGNFCLPGLAPPRTAAAAESSRHGQDTISSRLDRLESICLRIESYVRMAFGSLDRRLRMLEVRSQQRETGPVPPEIATRESPSSPVSPIFLQRTGAVPCSVSTFVTPDMLKHPAVLALGDAAATTSDACLSPIQMIPSPSFIMSTGRPESCSTEDAGKPEIAGVAVFSLAGDSAKGGNESTAEALLREPVVAWDNEGFPYLRPTQQVAMAPPLRDSIVMTWDGVGYLSRDTSDDDVATCLSSDDDAFSYNFNSFEQPRHSPEPPTDNAAGTSTTDSEEASPSNQHEEVMSVVERLFNSLISIPSGDLKESTSERVELGFDEASETPSGPELPQHEESLGPEEAAESGRGFELITLDTREAGIVPRVRLASKQQHNETSGSEQLIQQQRISSSDMRLKVDFPRLQDAVTSDGHAPPVTVHVAVAPKETAEQDAAAASIVQDVSLWADGPYQGRANYDVVPELPLESREAVVVSRDKVHLTQELVADYTVKVVPRRSTDGDCSETPSAEADNVSSTIHQLCFSVDVPVKQEAASVENKPDLPLEIAVGLSGNPLDGEAAAENVLKKGVASVVLNLEALQRSTGPSSVASTSSQAATLSRSESQGSLSSADSRNSGDSSCLLKVEDRRLVMEEGEVPAVKQDVCISVEVSSEAAGRESPETKADAAPGVQIGIAVKTVPSIPQLGAVPAKMDDLAVAKVEIPAEADFQRVPFEDIAPLAVRDVIPTKEELAPLATAENMFQEVFFPIDDRAQLIEPLAAPPPSPVDSSPSASLTENPFKELTQLKRVVKCRENQESDWHSESIFMVKDNAGPVLAMVPKAVLAGIAPADLIRGSLHYDGKACLLSVCMEDIWTPEDMCQAPVSAADAFPQPNSNFEPFCVRGCVRELKAELDWIADKSNGRAFGFLKQQAESRDEKTKSKSLGFFHSQGLPGKAAGTEQAPPRLQPASDIAFGVHKAVSQQQQQQQQQPQSTQALSLLLLHQQQEGRVPEGDVFADWDSSLSLVSRSPAKQKLKMEPEREHQQLETLRVPDSPGARSCIIDGDVAPNEEPKTKVPDSPGATSCILHGESPRVGPALQPEPEREQQQQHPKLALIGRPPLYPATTTATRALDVLEAASCSDEESRRTSSGDLHLLPLEQPDTLQQEEEEAGVQQQQQQQEMFYDALQCSGSASSQLGHSCAACGPKPALFLLA